jgi:hypothetical protein
MITLEQLSDQVSFEVLSKNQPNLIAAIRAALAAGASPAMIEALAIKRAGASLTAAVIAGAAHYIEKEQTQ